MALHPKANGSRENKLVLFHEPPQKDPSFWREEEGDSDKLSLEKQEGNSHGALRKTRSGEGGRGGSWRLNAHKYRKKKIITLKFIASNDNYDF